MQRHLQIFLLIVIAITLIALIGQIRAKKLELEYTLTWLVLLFVLLIFVLFPGLQNWLSALMGIAVPVNMIFFLGFCVALIILFRLTKDISKLSVENKKLTQRIALLEKTVDEMKEEKK